MASNYPNSSEFTDSKSFGTVVVTRDECFARPEVNLVVEKDACEYNMNHSRRGKCLIFFYSEYDPALYLSKRENAKLDAENTKRAFKKLGFEVEPHQNLRLCELRNILNRTCAENHSDCDCLAVVFMSHGSYKEEERKQWFYAFDEKFLAEELFHKFVGSNCLSLAGKPKLFFIQACRGEQTDVGISLKPGLTGFTDGEMVYGRLQMEYHYTIPSYADTLIMWASYPGFYAFKTNNNGIRGSVFIHFLSQILNEEGQTENLANLLLKVTRKVAVEFESHMTEERMNHNKQVPYTETSLLRHIYFKPKSSKNEIGINCSCV